MKSLAFLRYVLSSLLILLAWIPMTASAYYYQRYYPTPAPYYPATSYGTPSVVYPYGESRVIIHPQTTYWYGSGHGYYYRPYYPHPHYGQRPCFMSGNTLVCW